MRVAVLGGGRAGAGDLLRALGLEVLEDGTGTGAGTGADAVVVLDGGRVPETDARLVLHVDDPQLRRSAGTTFGTSPDAAVRADDLVLDDDGRAGFRLTTPRGAAGVRLQVVGEHQVAAALAAAAVLVDDDVEQVAARLSAVTALAPRRLQVRRRADGVTVVDDTADADPGSARAALRALAVLSRGKQRRTWAVLGALRDAGDDPRQAHMDLGRFLVRLDPTALVVVGREAGGVYAGAVLEGSWGGESVHVADAEEALALLAPQVRPDDVVLVKGAGLAPLADALQQVPSEEGPP